MSPTAVMAMQRAAGNRATVQALRPRPMSSMLETLRPSDEEEAVDGAAGLVESTTGLGESAVATGSPGGSPPGGGAAGGGAPGGGAAGSGTQGGGSGSPNAKGGSAGVRPDMFSSPTGASSKSGETAKPKPKPDLEKGSSAGADAARIKAGETAGAPGPASGGASGGKAGEVAAAPPRTGRRTEPPPIVAAGAAETEAATGAGVPAPAGATPGTKPAPAPGTFGPAMPNQAPAAAANNAPLPAAATAPTPTAGVLPGPETAQTGINWNQLLADWGPPARTVLEVTRLVPGWGLLGGLAADSINFASDLASIPTSENADLATGLVVFRNFVNIGNNGVGHVLYVNQLIQDGLAGSVVGVEFTPLTAAANEALSTVKVVLDEVMMGADIIVEVESLYQANHAPTSAEAEQWRALADGYAANILGDVVNLVLDVISLSSAGAANTAPIQTARQPLTLAGAFMRNAAPNIISAVNGVLGVWLGSLVTKGRQAYVGSPTELRAESLALDAAGLVIDVEGPQARAMYDGINVAIDVLGAYADEQIAQINLVAEALSGGKSAFELIRDAVQSGLEDMSAKLSMLEQLGSMATNGQENAATIAAACDSVLEALDALVMPSVTLEAADLGEGDLADAAEAVAGLAAEAANVAIEAAMAEVREALETAKSGIRGPVEAVQQRADDLGEWLAILATESTRMIATLNGHITSFSEGLGRCTNIEQVIDLIIGQVADLTGMPRVTVQEIRDAWNSVGPYIDQFTALGPRLHSRASDLRAHADLIESGEGAAGPTSALPPEPPPDTDAAAATMAAVA